MGTDTSFVRNQDAWINTCINGIGERAGNADLLSCILAFRYGFGVSEAAVIGDPVDLGIRGSWRCSSPAAGADRGERP
jgi:hypothetical protein